MVFIRKMLLASIGAFSMTRERAEEIVDDLIKRGEMSKGERAKFIRELMDKAEARSRELGEKIDEHVEKATAKLRGSTSEDMGRLEEKIDALAQEVAELKKSLLDKA